MKNITVACGALLLLSACAGSVNAPTLQSAPTAAVDVKTVPLGKVTAEAGPGVTMASYELSRITEKVQTELAAEYAGRVVATNAADPPGEVNIKLVFTEYDKGSAFARAMLAGLGQMHIHANVILTDASTGATLETFEATKDFGWGGLYGGVTSIEDLEDGFAKSVAEIFKPAGT
jgi:hypothetical protein